MVYQVEKATEYCVNRVHGAEYSADVLAADEWIKTEWPKTIAEFSPEDTLQCRRNRTVL
jgi:hypothetical protein